MSHLLRTPVCREGGINPRNELLTGNACLVGNRLVRATPVDL